MVRWAVSLLARLGRGLLLLVIAVVLVEAASFLFFAGWTQQWFSFSKLRAAQQQRLVEAARAMPAPARVETPAARYNVIHPYVGFVGDPSHPHWKEIGHGPDEYGFGTSSGPILKRAPDKLIVALLGGSVAMALPVGGVAAMRSELEQSPAMRGRQLIVLNFAGGGYKQPQQLMTISYFLALGAEFDVVLNLDGFNEVVLPVVENIPSGTFPFYPRSWNLLASRVDDLKLLSRMGEIAYTRAEQADLAEALLGSGLRYSVTANVTWALLDHLWSSRAFRSERALQTGTDVPRSYQRNGPMRTYRDADEMYRDLAGVWRNASLQLSRLGRENGFLYLHFLQPNQYDVDSKPLTAEERASAHDPSHPYAKAAQSGYPYLRAAGRELSELGVSFHDLTRLFADDRRTLYVDTCCHLNQEGNRTLGARMGAILRASLEQR